MSRQTHDYIFKDRSSRTISEVEIMIGMMRSNGCIASTIETSYLDAKNNDSKMTSKHLTHND
jgi:hypothetical protein